MASFRPSRLLGAGSFGEVFECSEHDEHGTLVRDGLAIKYLADEWLHDQHACNRFRREVRLTRGLEHPGIVPILHSNLSAPRPYMVMPLAHGNLSERLRMGHTSDRDGSLELFASLLHAMAHAHSRGVLHRDLKPDNVLLLDHRPVICDFGMGKDLLAIPTARTTTSEPIGSLAYVAPEQWSDPRSASYPADVFSLGKLLWELLANRAPRPWEPELHYIDPPPLRDFIERCTLTEPSLRYRDAKDGLDAWSALADGAELSHHPLDEARLLIEAWTRTQSPAQGRSQEGAPRQPRHHVDLIEQLDALLRRHRHDELLYYDLLPRLPEPMLARYCTQLPARFADTLAAYAAHTEGELPWEYCDEAARVHATAFEACPDESVRRRALTELLDLGQRHERYAVADVVRRLLWNAQDLPSATLAAQVIETTPQAAWYRHWNTFRRPLHPRVKAAFKRTPRRAAVSGAG